MGGVIAVLIAAVLVAGAAAGVFLARARKRSAPPEPSYHFRCPGCRRRLRYQARQIGHRGLCPTCKQALTFPPASQAIE
jgi:hypothetical protein